MAAPVPVARVVAVQGRAYAKGEDGALRPLHAGDLVYTGEIVVTGSGAAVDLATMDGQPFTLGANEALTIDAGAGAPAVSGAAEAAALAAGGEFRRTVAALDEARRLDGRAEETVSRPAPEENAGGGPTFVRLQRIVENLDPLRFEFDTARRGGVDEPLNGGRGDTGPTTPGTPTLDLADGNGLDVGQATVLERGLLDPDDTSASAAGTITLHAPGGLTSLGVGGATFTAAQLGALATAPQSVDTGIGTLTLTGYDPATGALTYTYALNAAQHQPGLAHSTDDIALTVAGPGGSAGGTLTIDIIDSLPAAADDAARIGEDAAANVVAGSVLGNDSVGADANPAPVTPGTFVLKYGTLVLNADGSYTYTLDNANPEVNALKTGQTLSDSHVYTLTDGDGDTATATLTITIDGHTDGAPDIAPFDSRGVVGAEATVDEQGLTSAADTGETTAGTIVLTAPDGLKSIAVGGTSFTAAQLADAVYLAGHPVDTGEGTLTLTGYAPATGTLSYSYTLKSALDQPGAVDSLDAIALSVTDAADATSAGTLTVRIVDSVPVAHADINAVTEDTATTASGNVIALGAGADTLGADSATTVTGVAAGTHASAAGQVGSGVAGAYGTLTLASDGGYTYVLDNASAAIQALATGQTVTDTFTYTITDADGDTSTTTLTLTVNGTNDAPDITVQAGDSAAAALSETDAGLTAGGTLSIGDVDTLDTVTPSVFSVTAGGTYAGLASLSSQVTNAQLLAMLSVTGGESSTTAQDNPHGIAWAFDSGSQAFNFLPVGETLTLTYVVRATDNHGASDDQPVTITITGTNDGITLHDDARTIAENANAAGRSGNVLTNDVLDQDYGQVTQVTGFSLDANGDGNAENYLPGASVTITSASGGTLGVFTLAANGAYSFTPHESNYSGPVPVVTYTAGSSTNSATATLTLTVSPVSDAPGVTPDAAKVTTPEDTAVALGLNAPTVSDATDQNGTAAGDDPERRAAALRLFHLHLDRRGLHHLPVGRGEPGRRPRHGHADHDHGRIRGPADTAGGRQRG